MHRSPPPGVALSVGDAVVAARDGDTASLRAWLDAGGDPDQYDASGWTPLLAASVRGCSDVVELLLSRPAKPAEVGLPHRESGALPIHFAGHSGDVRTAECLLRAAPSHLDAVWLLNGHTLFLQAVFYGHLDLARFALERGASTAATTVRGLGGLELAEQFENHPMVDAIRPYDRSPEEKQRYHRALLRRIAPVNDRLVDTIEAGLQRAVHDPGAVEDTVQAVRAIVEAERADVNALGGPLQQPPLVVVVTGHDGSPANRDVRALRRRLAEFLLERGADPTIREQHPMAVNAIIRAAVFNHLEILQRMGELLSSEQLAAALNEQPMVNGLTALHDTVLRATTAGPDRLNGYVQQIRWCVAHGARTDLEDFSGRTQLSIAENVEDPALRRRLLDALGG